jgi:hypothetical protein
VLKKIAVVTILISIAFLTGCMSNQEKMELNNRLDALESKSNEAQKTAIAAQIDASTALHIAVENQEKLK